MVGGSLGALRNISSAKAEHVMLKTVMTDLKDELYESSAACEEVHRAIDGRNEEL